MLFLMTFYRKLSVLIGSSIRGCIGRGKIFKKRFKIVVAIEKNPLIFAPALGLMESGYVV